MHVSFNIWNLKFRPSKLQKKIFKKNYVPLNDKVEKLKAEV